ncbi:MAG TPA: alpha/beta hydrolase [Chloroflexi bacterium]|nr:alpha/beta hydrolase [Chloroflexota bacterium]
MNTLFIDTDYANVFAKSAGKQGDPLVLGIHGYSQRNGWHTWEPLLAPLAEAGFWVVSVDMPGWGQSVLHKPQRLTKDTAVDAVIQIIDGLGAETAVLMGKSWGGGVALDTAVAHPGRISQLILTAPARRSLDDLADLTQPVLLAWAKDDPVIPYEYAQKYVQRIPHIQLETYETGGHSAAQKNADDFAPKAVAFLQTM